MAEKLILNRYRPLEASGKGGFGTVDVAWDSRLQRRVAIKRIPLLLDKGNVPGIREARTAAMLNDAHVVTVLDFQVTATEALIIMEYVDGPTLSTLLRESEELLSLDVIATIVSDVASALEYAHENQVLHLDIKPDNVLIDHQGNIKVSDFGLSQLSGIAGFSEPQGGTIGYMPPEQLLVQGVDERTDLWALAVLLYQLLTGKNPFSADTVFESLDRILYEEVLLPSEIRADLDPRIDDIIFRAMAADKAQRFDSVPEWMSEVSAFLGNTQAGRKALKYRVNERDLDELVKSDAWHQEDEESGYAEDGDYDESAPRAGLLWDRFPRRLRGALGRLSAAVACGSFACMGLSGFDLLAFQNLQSTVQFGLLIGIVAIIALGAFLVPQLGSALACVVFIAGIFARGLVPAAIILALLLIAWWLFFGRKSAVDSTLVMLAPLLGALSMGFALPLLSGYFQRPKRALLTVVIQCLLLTVIAVATNSAGITRISLMIPEQQGMFGEVLFEFITSPTLWITFAAFILAALTLSLMSGRMTRNSALLGIIFATIILGLGSVASHLLFDPSLLPADLLPDGVGLALSFILVLVIFLSGIPVSDAYSEEA